MLGVFVRIRAIGPRDVCLPFLVAYSLQKKVAKCKPFALNHLQLAMSIKGNRRIWRVGVAVLLFFAFLLVSVGSSSAAFHHWLHGDDVDCTLAYPGPGTDSANDESSEHQNHEHGDPLEPFCHSGFLLQASLETQILEEPRVLEPVVRRPAAFDSLRLWFYRPTRAPPVLI